MGDWRVRLSWNHATGGKGSGFHAECLANNPKSAQSVLAFQCMPVVEQHQYVGPEVPEFTISVKWQDGDLDEYLAGRNSRAHGWRWTLRWVDAETQETRMATGYGFSSDRAARDAAELKAIKIAKAQQPEQVYKFRPEL